MPKAKSSQTKAKTPQQRKPTPPVPMPGKDYDLDLPTGALSFSQIDTYMKCALQYYFDRVLKRPRKVTVHLQEGQAMAGLLHHTNLAFLYTGEHLSLEKAYTEYTKIAKQELAKVDKEGWYGETKASVMERGEEFIDLYWNTRPGDQGPDMIPIVVPFRDLPKHEQEIPGTEYEFEVEIAGVPVKGFIDLIEKGSVIDFKVASAARWYDAATSLQLALYAHVAQKNRVGYVIFEKKKMCISEKFEQVHLPSVKRRLDVTVSNVAKGISEGVFPPCQPNSLCSESWCDHWKYCMGRMR